MWIVRRRGRERGKEDSCRPQGGCQGGRAAPTTGVNHGVAGVTINQWEVKRFPHLAITALPGYNHAPRLLGCMGLKTCWTAKARLCQAPKIGLKSEWNPLMQEIRQRQKEAATAAAAAAAAEAAAARERCRWPLPPSHPAVPSSFSAAAHVDEGEGSSVCTPSYCLEKLHLQRSHVISDADVAEAVQSCGTLRSLQLTTCRAITPQVRLEAPLT